MTRVIVNGCFDILHSGHLKLLKAAKDLGVVCVAIDSDPRVQQLKGLQRPVNTCYKRKEMLEALRYVDYVVVFNSEDELKEIIRDWKPHYMVKGEDYINKPIVGADLVKNIVYVSLTDDSTTKIIQRTGSR